MARLAIGVAGAALGGFVGGPTGARIGFAVGSFIGGQLFPDPPSVSEGPRLGDLNVSQSTYGSPIPIGYGTIRMGSNLIWAGDVQEVESRSETSGGKGGSPPSSVQVTYSYFADFAVSFGEGPADEVLRIWMDKKLVYDKRGQGTVADQRLSFKFYKGDEEQLADPTIEAKEGVGEVPGHRGLVYIVFNTMALQDFGNRIPQVEAEIAYASTSATSDRFSNDFTPGEGGIFGSIDQTEMAVDHKRRRIYVLGGTGPSPTLDGIRIYNQDTLQEIRQVSTSDILNFPVPGVGFTDGLTVGQSGFLYAVGGSGNGRPVFKIDPDSMNEVARFGFESVLVGLPTTGAVTSWPGGDYIVELPMICAVEAGTTSHFNFIVMRGIIGGQGRLFVANSRTLGMASVADYAVTPNLSLAQVIGIAPQPAGVNVATGWIASQSVGNATIDIYQITIQPTADYIIDAISNERRSFDTEVTLVDSIPNTVWDGDGISTEAVFTVDKSDNSLIFIHGRASSAGSYVFKWREGDGIVWTTQSNTQVPGGGDQLASTSNVDAGLLGWVSVTEDAALIDTADGSLVVDQFSWSSLTPSTNVAGPVVFDGRTQSVIALQGAGAPGVLGQIFLNRSTGVGTTDGAIVSNVSQRVGFDLASEIDVTELTHPVRGFAISRRMAARSALETLGTAFLWDGVESDGKVVYKNRGRAAIRVIDDSEMVPQGDTNDAVVEERMQEVELPERVSVSYMDIDLDYQIGTQSSKRILVPDPTMRSRNEAAIPLAIVFNSGEARQISETVLFTAWNERVKYSWKTSWEQLDLDPADVVTLTLNGETTVTTVRTRITSAMAAVNLSVSFTGFKEDQVTVLSDAVGGGNPSFPQQVIPAPFDSRLFLLDIPLLRDIDDTGRSSSRLHVLMNGFTDEWPGAVLYEGADGVTFNNTGIKSPTGASYGTMLTTLPPTDFPFITDKTTQLQVLMTSGTLSSVTDVEFEDGQVNAAAVGTLGTPNWEIIRFQNAVQQSDSSYILTNLRRGRRGSETMRNRHLDGETFILLDRGTTNTRLLDIAQKDVVRFYKAVGFGQVPENAVVDAFPSTLADLKPYAPVHAAGVVDGGSNIDLTWVKRTRVGGALRDGVGTVPLSEDSESYEVDIREADPYWENVVLLMPFEGADTDTFTTDFSNSAHTSTFGGDAQIDTAQFKFGASSLLSDGNNDIVTIPRSNDFIMADDEQFTLEYHIRFASLTGIQTPLAIWEGTPDFSFLTQKLGSNQLQFAISNDGTSVGFAIATTTWTPVINTWYHVAVDRDKNGLVNLYVDGVVLASGTYTPGFFNSAAPLSIIAESIVREVNGHMDEVRITKGVARYQGAFTPPTRAHPNGTVLRTLASTTPAVQYDNADILSDLGSVPSQLNVEVVQISAQVGRGFSEQVIIDIT